MGGGIGAGKGVAAGSLEELALRDGLLNPRCPGVAHIKAGSSSCLLSDRPKILRVLFEESVTYRHETVIKDAYIDIV